ncbi:MAG: N-acetylmuramoyl-L-alanine amidase [Candidatus Cyclobacteriaceae bacterium M3_2C_046]
MAVKIILHCSDSGFGNAALIAKWHALPANKVVQNGKSFQGRGWNGIGYHYVILNGWLTSTIYNSRFNGHLETGRPLDHDPVVQGNEVGAHVKSYNINSVGICLIGRSGQFTNEQLITAVELIYDLEKQFYNIAILQHSELDPGKAFCAGLNMDLFRQNYQQYKIMKESVNAIN